MKIRLIASAALLALFGGSAIAADLPVKAPPPPVPVWNWTGFYLGGHIGAFWGNTSQSLFVNNSPPFNADQIVPVTFGRDTSARLMGGLHAGYNWQVAPSWVIGVEGDASALDGSFQRGPVAAVDNTSGLPLVNPNFITMSHSDNWLMSIRGRVGFTADNWLFYGTGGAAWDNRTFTGTWGSGGNVASVSTLDRNRTDLGWVAGAGVEWAPWHNGLMVRAEYLYYSFPSESFVQPCGRCVPGAYDGPGTWTWNGSHLQVVRLGLSYKWGVGPILAKD